MSQTHSLLIILAFSLLISTSLSTPSCSPKPKPKPKPDPKYTTFVKTACNTTTYPSLCQKTCMPFAADIKGDPQKLVVTALNVSLSAVQTTAHAVADLAEQKSGNLTKYEANAMKDCIENMGDSIDELKDSIDQMKELGSSSSSSSSSNSSKEMKFKISNVQTWMSAAITNENTCMDGIKEHKVSSYVKRKIRGQVLGVAKLTSNALSLCNHLQY